MEDSSISRIYTGGSPGLGHVAGLEHLAGAAGKAGSLWPWTCTCACTHTDTYECVHTYTSCLPRHFLCLAPMSLLLASFPPPTPNFLVQGAGAGVGICSSVPGELGASCPSGPSPSTRPTSGSRLYSNPQQPLCCLGLSLPTCKVAMLPQGTSQPGL